jgi:hypothetical protein
MLPIAAGASFRGEGILDLVVRDASAPRKTGSLSGSVIITDTGWGSPQSVALSGTGD